MEVEAAAIEAPEPTVSAETGEPVAEESHSTQVEAPETAEAKTSEGEAEGGADTKVPDEETFEVKVDGEIREFTLDELKKAASAGQAANERFEQAAKIRKDAQATLERVEQALIDNPLGVVSHLQKENPYVVKDLFLGMLESSDPVIQASVNEAIQMAQASPEAKAQRQLERENEQLRREREQYQSQHEKRRLQQAQQQIIQRFEELAPAAMESVGLACNDISKKDLAAVHNQLFGDNVPLSQETMAQAARALAEERPSAVAEAYLSAMPPEKLRELLGPDQVKSLTQAQVDQVKKMQSAPPSKNRAPAKANPAERAKSLEQLKYERELARLNQR